MKSWATKARESSGLSPEDCASAIRKSRATYLNREDNPGKFDVDELRALRGVYKQEGRELLWNALQEFKP